MDRVIATQVIIYSRPGCHLCEEMKAVVERVASRHRIHVEEIDISGDRALETLYGQDIPVLVVDGRKAAKYRISEPELTRLLAARSLG
jgi:glutaredoxin